MSITHLWNSCNIYPAGLFLEWNKIMTFPVAKTVKSLPAMLETWVQSLGQEDPLGKKWQPTPVFLPGEFHRQRSLVGYSPWGSQRARHNWATNTFTFFHGCEMPRSLVICYLCSENIAIFTMMKLKYWQENPFSQLLVFTTLVKPFTAEAATSWIVFLGSRSSCVLIVVACGGST